MQQITEEQIYVLHLAAVMFLKEKPSGDSVYFIHELCEGTLKFTREGVYGPKGGTFFHADLGVIRGERSTIDFFLPRGAEYADLEDEASITLITRRGKDGSVEGRPIDTKRIKRPTRHTLQ